MLISNKELIELLAEQSRYYKYQIEDILYALAVVLQEQLNQGNDIKIKGVGTFSRKNPRRLKNYSKYLGDYLDTWTKVSVKYKPDTLMLNSLNADDTKEK